MEVKPNWDSENISPSTELVNKRCPSNRGIYVDIFLGTKFCIPEWRCPKGEIPIYMKYLNVISM